MVKKFDGDKGVSTSLQKERGISAQNQTQVGFFSVGLMLTCDVRKSPMNSLY